VIGLSAHPCDIRTQGTDAHYDAIGFEAFTDGFQTMTVVERRPDFRPKPANLTGFGRRFFVG
jgi:hypothetical protein